MGIDIENPGADEADLRAAIGLYAGQVLIASAAVGAPAANIDIELPAGYIRYILRLDDWAVNTGDFMTAVFSEDDGSTFLADSIGYSGYTVRGLTVKKNGEGATEASPRLSSDALGYLYFGAGIDGAGPVNCEINIFPGSASMPAATQSRTLQRNSVDSSGYMDFCDSICRLNTARVTNIRLQPYGNGDTPPSSDHVISAGGVWTLFGVPSPA